MGATEGFGRALHRAQARSLLRNSSYFTVCVAVITGMIFYFLVGYCRCAEMLLIYMVVLYQVLYREVS